MPAGGDHLSGIGVHEPTAQPGPGGGGRLAQGGLQHLVAEPAPGDDAGRYLLGQAPPGRGQLGPGQVDGVEDVASARAGVSARGGLQKLLLGDPLQVAGRTSRLSRLAAAGAQGLELAQ